MGWERSEFERLFRARYPDLVRFAHGLTGNREAGEDVVQEGFVRLWDRGPSTRPDADHWLFRVCRNLALDWMKQEHRRSRREQHGLSEVDPPAFSDDATERVREVVRSLPPRYREVLLLREFGGLSHTEIAGLVGRKENTVRQDLHRARQRLRELWVERSGDES